MHFFLIYLQLVKLHLLASVPQLIQWIGCYRQKSTLHHLHQLKNYVNVFFFSFFFVSFCDQNSYYGTASLNQEGKTV